MMTPTIFIVDDEAPARERMTTLLSDIQAECPHLLIGEASDAKSALKKIAELQPDIILLDVQMPEMSGMEMAQYLRDHEAISGVPAIIFITAYDEFAFPAFGVQAADYLLKPVRANRLADAIIRVANRLSSAVSANATNEQTSAQVCRESFSVLERGRILLVPVGDVLFLKAEQKYVTLYTSQKEFLLEESLTSLETELKEKFIRIHRNALVAKAAIAGVERATHIVDMDGENEKVSENWQVIVAGSVERLPISRRQWPLIKALVR